MASPRGCTNLKLRQLTRLVARHYERFFTETGLKGTQYSLLSHAALLAPIGAGEFAAAMKLSPSALSRNLQPLLARGLLTLAPGDDARSRIVDVTAAGRALRAEAAANWKRAQLALNARLGADRVVALHALLDGCIDSLGDAGGDGGEDD